VIYTVCRHFLIRPERLMVKKRRPDRSSFEFSVQIPRNQIQIQTKYLKLSAGQDKNYPLFWIKSAQWIMMLGV
jgi:hypothetical protein